MSVNITKIQQTGNMISLWYENDGTECRVIRPADNCEEHVNEFINGIITADELVAFFGDNTDQVVEQTKTKIMSRLERLSDHLSTDGMHIYFDGADFGKIQLDTTLENHLVRMLTNKDDNAIDWISYINFTERLYRNVDVDIRSRIVEWLAAQDWLTFTDDGRLVGYRGTQRGADGTPESIHQGPGIVDGLVVNGHVPNPVGSIIEIDRSMVTKDSTQGCSSGLHVGTYNYAVNWAQYDGYVLRVAVAPEDIVSVPYDCDAQKIRCCRFEVLEATPASEFKTADNSRFYDDLTYVDDDDDAYDVAWDAWVGAGEYSLYDNDDNFITGDYFTTISDLADAIWVDAAAYARCDSEDSPEDGYDEADEDDFDDFDETDNENAPKSKYSGIAKSDLHIDVTFTTAQGDEVEVVGYTRPEGATDDSMLVVDDDDGIYRRIFFKDIKDIRVLYR